MSDALWRVAYDSVIGTSHEKTGLPCQDAAGCRIVSDPVGRPILLAIACDGAGSASRSLDGATLTVARFLDEFGKVSKRSAFDEISHDFVQRWLARLRTEIKNHADADELAIREFACTVLAAIIGEDRAAFFQIGDGAIVVSNRSEPGDYGWVFWPQHGEFANQTNFVTQENAHEVLVFELEERHIDEVAIFTDGLERLVLNLTEKTAHQPFFRTLFKWLIATEPSTPGVSMPASSVVHAYLGSRQICDRTDDDKTLILASRRQIPSAETIAVDA